MAECMIENLAVATPIALVTASGFSAWCEGQPEATRNWLEATGFSATGTNAALIPKPDGGLGLIVQPAETGNPIWSLGALPDSLPEGDYRLDEAALAYAGIEDLAPLVLGWMLGSYAYTRYKARKRKPAQLAWPEGLGRTTITALAEGIFLTRDLINTPAEEMGPADLAEAATKLAGRHAGALITIIEGDQLLGKNFPLIHAVGRASSRAPRLIDMEWGHADAPKLTLVGKGVCFDSGGLDIKPASGMRMMKKDMGGAATVLGLAHAIMAAGLKLRLRVLIPAVENSISANAFRPGDVFRSRKGLTVEIGNTDAEGRLILADALAEACAGKPDMLLDIATLTGAARTALGPELPALFSADEDLAAGILKSAAEAADPLWRLPLWQPYRKMIKGKIADIDNSGEGGMAGAITAALFLESFVEPGISWAHIDSYAWNGSNRPGRPEGGEALTLRALFHYISGRFAA